jgi:hypothetical protein
MTIQLRLILVICFISFSSFSLRAAEECSAADEDAVSRASLYLSASDPDNNNLEEGMVGSIVVDFQKNRCLFQLSMCIHTKEEFHVLSQRQQEKICKLYPEFPKFLETSDKIGEQLETSFIEFAPRSCKTTIFLQTPVLEMQVPQETFTMPYVTCTVNRQMSSNSSHEVRRILAAEKRRRAHKELLSQSRLARLKESLRDKLR